MGGKSSPPTPDYKGAAEASAASSKEANTAQTWANRPTTTTPWGSQTWSTGTAIDPATGQKVTTWNQNIQLTPEQQQALNSQQAIQQGRSDAAQTLLGQATSAFQTPVDYGSLPQGGQSVSASNPMVTALKDPNSVRQQAQDAVWQLQKPMLDEQRASLQTQLANQGIAQGSAAYDSAMRGQSDAEARAQLQAIQAGQSEANQMFNQNLQSGQFTNNAYSQGLQNQIQAGQYNTATRAATLAEMLQQRGQPLNELNALLTGQQVNMPNMPGFSQAGKSQGADYLGAANMQYGADLNNYNAGVGNMNNLIGTAANIGGLALGGFFSDVRLKENIVEVGKLPSGLPVIEWNYRGIPTKFIGVRAQDALKTHPEAVTLDASGFYKVDYSKVH